MRRLLWSCAAVAVCVLSSGTEPAAAQGATSCDSPCKVTHLPLVGPRGAVCDSPCKLINLPLIHQTAGASQAKLPFRVMTVDSATMDSIGRTMRPTESGATGDSPVYFHYQVGRPAKVAGSPKGPTYPDSLKESNVMGEVTMTFIVGTTGSVESSSLKIVKTTHPLFSDAVREWLLQLRFIPAEKNGAKVRQSVEQTVVFHNPR